MTTTYVTSNRPLASIPSAVLMSVIKRGKYERFATMQTGNGTIGEVLQAELAYRRNLERGSN